MGGEGTITVMRTTTHSQTYIVSPNPLIHKSQVVSKTKIYLNDIHFQHFTKLNHLPVHHKSPIVKTTIYSIDNKVLQHLSTYDKL